MLDQTFRRLIDPPLNMIAAALAPHISANMLTLIGFILALLCFGALAAGAYMGALALLLCNRLLDGLDGPVARHSARGATDFGGYIDIVTDFIFYGGFVFFFAVGDPSQALAAAFLIFCFVASGTSFLAAAILAAKRNVTTDAQGKKSFFYFAGLMEGTETIIAFVLICLMPAAFTIIAGLFGVLCLVTAAARVAVAHKQFGP